MDTRKRLIPVTVQGRVHSCPVSSQADSTGHQSSGRAFGQLATSCRPWCCHWGAIYWLWVLRQLHNGNEKHKCNQTATNCTLKTDLSC